jgi:ABC-type iron transport system FetAB ATPase subunit
MAGHSPEGGLSPPRVRLKVASLSRPGLAPFDLELAAGEAVALYGPSGAGKTLMLRAIADLDPNDGEASLDGAARGSMPAPDWRRQVTYLAAEPGWWAERGGEHLLDPQRAQPLIEAVGLTAAQLEAPVASRSPGERHRLALVRVLEQAPAVLLLDEPTSGLDEASTARVEALLRERLAAGSALLFSTHDEAQGRRLARRALRMDKGRLTEAAP